MRVLVVDDNADVRRALVDFLEDSENIDVCGHASNGFDAVDEIRRLQPDVVVLDLIMPKLDGVGVLERIQEMGGRPRVLVLSAFGEESLISRAYELGATYFLMKPFPLPLLVKRLVQMAGEDPKGYTGPTQGVSRLDVERRVSRLMAELGVPSHYKGYAYLKDAVMMVVEDMTLMSQVTKNLYSRIAEAYTTTPQKVERSIRHAIETAWSRGNLDLINELFAYTVDVDKGRPTNSSFIAQVADYVRLQVKVAS